MTNPSLSVFSTPPTDFSTQSVRWIKISPTTSSLTPIQFYLEKQADFIDMSRSYFEFDLRFQTTTPGNIAANDNDSNDAKMTAFVNNMPHSMIKQFLAKCNGTLLSEAVDMYHHKAYLQSLLNYDRNDGETIMNTTNGNWRNEIDNPATYTANNVTGPAADGTNAHADYTALSENHKAAIQAMKKETRDVWSGGKRKILRMVPNDELFHQDKWIVPNTSFEFQIWLNSTTIWTNNVVNTAVREPTTDDCKVTFYMCLVKINPGIYTKILSK